MTTLLVASGGGHLKQLHGLLPRFDLDDNRIWVTFDTPLSRSLLKDESDIRFAPYANPHDPVGSLRDLIFAARLYRSLRADGRTVTDVISTGANLGAVFLPIARLMGARAYYIESATRSEEPSLTGKILQRIPGVRLYTQHRHLVDSNWRFGGSVFEGFEPIEISSDVNVKKIVVTLGNNDTYPFDRLIRRLLNIVPSDVEVLWQLGITKNVVRVDGSRSGIPVDELEKEMRDADVVIAHAGTGSALSALEAGKRPLLIPRLASYGEHVDNHQLQTAQSLTNSGHALTFDANDLTWDDIISAASWKIVKVAAPAKFQLDNLAA